jgi:hypothetical protein
VLKLHGKDFTVGRSKFADRLEEHAEPTAKIYVKIRLDGLDAVLLAQLDTGAAWSVLEPEIADALDVLNNAGPTIRYNTRDGIIPGRLIRLPLIIVADEGDSVLVDATVFVSTEWRRGNFIGYSGLLERIRIALDPQANYFYFGPAQAS